MRNIFFQPPSSSLLIKNEDEFADIICRAKEIVTDCIESENHVLVLMSHDPTKEQIVDLATQAIKSGAPVALLGGHLGLMISLCRELSSRGINCFEAKSEKQSVEVIQPDGSTVKTSRFVYGGLRPLT